MTLLIKHKFQSLKPDGGDVTVVRPMNWNETHSVIGQARSIIGNSTAGAAEMSDVQIAEGLWFNAAGKLDLQAVSLVGFFLRTSAPPGWLKANGALISRTTYASLFSVIGTFFGAGDGVTTFALPDFRGYFLRAWADGASLDSGRAYGSAQADTVGPHTHGGTATAAGGHTHAAATTAAGNHTHLINYDGAHGSSSANRANDPLWSWGDVRHTNTPNNAGTQAAGSHTHPVTVTAVADHTHALSVTANSGTETRPDNYALLCCIKY